MPQDPLSRTLTKNDPIAQSLGTAKLADKYGSVMDPLGSAVSRNDPLAKSVGANGPVAKSNGASGSVLGG